MVVGEVTLTQASTIHGIELHISVPLVEDCETGEMRALGKLDARDCELLAAALVDHNDGKVL